MADGSAAQRAGRKGTQQQLREQQDQDAEEYDSSGAEWDTRV